MVANNPISLWDVSAQEQGYEASLDGDVTVDVAIVGGGYTGLSTALHCAEKGLSAHVLEAHQIGHGGSGRNVGLVNAGIWLPPKEVKEKLPPTYGERFLKTFGGGPEFVFSLIEKHQIRCEVTRTGTIHAAHSPKGFRNLEGRWKEWNDMGEPVDLLDCAEVSKLVGADVFYGGLVDHRAGTLNPMGYCRGLARAALGAGARISTDVTVLNLRKDGTLWKVETDKGVVTAKHVVLGTNAYTDKLWPDLRNAFTQISYFQMATKPLGKEAAHILPGRQGLWDTGQVMFSLRRDVSDRLIIGSMGKVFGSAGSGLSHRWARKQIARIFPELADIEFEEAWHGQIAMTPDYLPRIYNLDEGLYTAIGYNGRGITTGTIFGKSIAGLLTGMPPEDLPLPMATFAPVRSAPIMSRLYDTAFTANQILKSL